VLSGDPRKKRKRGSSPIFETPSGAAEWESRKRILEEKSGITGRQDVGRKRKGSYHREGENSDSKAKYVSRRSWMLIEESEKGGGSGKEPNYRLWAGKRW